MKYKPIFLGLTGSRLYGTHRPDSDYDYRGVVLGNQYNYLGELNRFEQTSNIDDVKLHIKDSEMLRNQDVEFYEVGKFIKLAWDANPNILELLFCDNILFTRGEMWEFIKRHRSQFLSQKVLHTFSGYAHSQLKRLKNHNAWVKNEPKKPERIAFGLPEKGFLNKEIIKLLSVSSNENIRILEEHLNSQSQDLIMGEINFYRVQQNYKKYKEWKENRNKKRFEFEQKYGYDVKHGSHLVRLYYECKRLLETGELIFPLPEAPLLKGILNGKWSYEEIIEFSETMDGELQNLCQVSGLPKSPDRKALNQLIISIKKDAL